MKRQQVKEKQILFILWTHSSAFQEFVAQPAPAGMSAAMENSAPEAFSGLS